MRLLKTSRLILDYANVKDAQFLFELMNDKDYLKNIGDRNITSIINAEDFIVEKFITSYHENGYGYYIIKLQNNHKPIGICGLVNREELNIIDIGFAILPDFRNNGYAYEATKALFDYAKSILNIEVIKGIVDEGNSSSIVLLKKLGLTFEKMIQLPNDPIICKLYSS